MRIFSKRSRVSTLDAPTSENNNNNNNGNNTNIVPAKPPIKDEVHVPICGFDALLTRIRRNDLVELKLGWRDNDYLTSKRRGLMLSRTLLNSNSITSNLRSVSIGWRHKSKDALVKTLKTLKTYSTNATNCARVTNLQLVLDDDVPEAVLKSMLSHMTGLERLELRAVYVSRRPLIGGSASSSSLKTTRVSDHFKNKKEKNAMDSSAHSDASVAHAPPVTKTSGGQYQSALSLQSPMLSLEHNVVSRVISRMYSLQHPHLKQLSLIDCGLTDASAIQLADFLHIRGGISCLSVRNNRYIGTKGLKVLCQAPVMEELDLSVCDIDTMGALAVATGIGHRPWPIKRLLLCGNYRMESAGLVALCSPRCCAKVASVNVSFCDIGNQTATLLYKTMAQLPQNCQLEEWIMQGSRSNKRESMGALCKLIQANNTLKKVAINDPTHPKFLSAGQVEEINDSLRNNYTLQSLDMDYAGERNKLDWYLRLNEAGRNILRTREAVAPLDWWDVLSKAGSYDDLDLLYWMVQQGAEHFER